MDKISTQRATLIGMLVAAVAVVALTGFAWDYARQTVVAARYVAHTHEVKSVIRNLEASLYQAEAGQRAYLATGTTTYQAERDEAVESLDKGMTTLAQLTTDNPVQALRVADLRREVAARIAVYRTSDRLLQSGSAYSAEQRIEVGAQVLANIRPHIDRLVAEEDHLLTAREAVQQERTRSTVGIFVAFVLLLLVLLPAIFWRMLSDLRARAAAEVLVAGERAFDAMHARLLTLYNAENDRKRVLDSTLTLLGENPLFPVGAFYAYDEWAGGLRLEASRAAPADIKPMVRLDEGLVATAAREGRALYLEGLQGEGGMNIETGLATVRPAAVLMCPVQHQSRLLGVLVLGAGRPLAERDRDFVVRMCAQLAVALNNLNHLEEMSLLTEQLRSRGEDIQRKNAELERANRMKSEFLANMSHELRTPLNAIIGFSEIMKDGLTGPLASPEQHEYVQDIHASGKHLLSLINDILDLSKVESGQVILDLEEADPHVLAASTMAVLRERAATARVRFSVQCPPDIGTLSLDMRKAKQIVYNLVSNALKFTPEGGTVTFAMERVSARQVNSIVSEAGTRVFAPVGPAFEHYLELRVTDSGIGIAPAELEDLFQAFVQIDSSLSRQYAGTGLGLTMVKRLAELHGGGLMVRSADGRGSTFAVWLPWRDASPQHAASDPLSTAATTPALRRDGGNGHDRPSPQGKLLVLVVEDDPRAANLMRLQLESNGYQVEFATSAEEGLERATALQPTAVVLDVVLPGMDGWDMLARLKERPDTGHIPVVIVSITDEPQRGFALGAAQVLVKPVTQHDLLSALAAAGLDEPHTGARVLVVDDDPKAVSLVSKHLQVAGYAPVGAYGGQEALDIVRSEAPALIVLDLMMPQVSGFDVVRGLRNHPDTAGIPVIVLTAKLLTQEDRALLSGKVQQVMEKTDFNSMGLVAEIKRALAGRQRAAWH
jgi:signal transduction histidine kinase/DNA-binding response OmpR family regulator/CHASE3 domain sensor protein